MTDHPGDYEVFRIPYPRRGAKRPVVVAAVITLACVVAAVVLGSIALRNPPAKTGGPNAIPGVSLPTLAPQPTAPSASLRPVTHPHRVVRKETAVTAQVGPVAPKASPARKAAGPPLAVRYRVDSQSSSGFQGEVDVTNNTRSPITDWQIVVALYGDVVTSVRNASAIFSNGILLLRPGPSGQAVPPGGGTISVSFTAEGFRTIPVACAFNGTLCT